MEGSVGSTAGNCGGSAATLVVGGSTTVGGIGLAATGSVTPGLGGKDRSTEEVLSVEDDHQ